MNKKSSSAVEFSHPFLGLLILGSGGFFSHVRREVLSGRHVFEGRRPKPSGERPRENVFPLLRIDRDGNSSMKVSEGIDIYNDGFIQGRMNSFSLGSKGY